MPEEINRVVADHLSDLLLCPSDTAAANLAAEGITANTHVTGDVMLDVLNWARRQSEANPPPILGRLGLIDRSYLLATVHRSENTDDARRLTGIVHALNALDETVIFPVHPRTLRALVRADCRLRPHIQVVDPLGYVEMVTLAGRARLVLTDSGGLQKESYWLRVPCLTLRDETEWVETVAAGWNVLVGSDSTKILDAVRSFVGADTHPPLYGDGDAGQKCVELLSASRAANRPVAPELNPA
jgi:UDP-N-acetylglucosamine 2-epimerase